MNKKDNETHIAVFSGKKIRRKLVNDKWFFSVVDIVGILSESENPRDYWYKLKIREQESSGIELSTFCRQLKLIAEDGKLRETDCADTEAIFRIIQSIPSKKAEPFKRWLAKVGYERVQEIENPELAQGRMKKLYEQKGYSKGWIDKRLRGIAVRQDLTEEWKKRGILSIKITGLLLILLGLIVVGMSMVSAATNVTNCQTLSSAGETYTLNASVSNNTITNDCMIASAKDINQIPDKFIYY